MNPPRRLRRISTALLAIGLGLSLSACETFDLADMIPDMKKKLPGERRAVFPDGVPGVPEGVPPELVKGYQAPPEGGVPADQVLQEEEKPKPVAKPKPRAKPRPVVQREEAAPPQPQPQSQQAAPAQWPSQQPSQQSAWPGTTAR